MHEQPVCLCVCVCVTFSQQRRAHRDEHDQDGVSEHGAHGDGGPFTERRERTDSVSELNTPGTSRIRAASQSRVSVTEGTSLREAHPVHLPHAKNGARDIFTLNSCSVIKSHGLRMIADAGSQRL